MPKLSGCYTAIITPFMDGQLDTRAMAEHAEWMVDQGVSGLVVNGTTGEAATISDDEKLVALNCVLEAVGDRAQVIMGAGNNSTSESLNFIGRVNQIEGLTAVMSVVPYYIRPPQAGLVQHFKTIADASTHPVIVYNVPSRTVVGLTVESMVELAEHPNICGFKEASADLYQDGRLFAQLGDADVSVLSGDDPTALAMAAIGGRGVISVIGNVAPKLMSDLIALALGGDFEEARKLNHKVVRLQELLFSTTNPIPVKAACSHLGFGDGFVRLPLVPMEGAALEHLRSELDALGVGR